MQKIWLSAIEAGVAPTTRTTRGSLTGTPKRKTTEKKPIKRQTKKPKKEKEESDEDNSDEEKDEVKFRNFFEIF